MKSLLVWDVVETHGVEFSWIEREGLAMSVEGKAAAQHPVPYSTVYSLRTDSEGLTDSMTVEVASAEGSRAVRLVRSGNEWAVDGKNRPDLSGATDVDLVACPVTDTMPIFRGQLHRHPGRAEVAVARAGTTLESATGRDRVAVECSSSV